MKKSIATSHAPSAIGPYSQAVVVDGLVFASGQIPLEPVSGKLVEGSVAVQTERVLDNLTAVLEASGATTADVVKTTIYLTDLSHFQEVNEVYARYFKPPFPARATVQVAALPRGAAVEIDAIAKVSALEE